MTAPMRMEEDRSHMTEKILNLTLEIIYLLTGERFPLVKSGDHMTITVPPCDSLKPERHNMEKILEVTKKMMELLTGEVRRILGIVGHYPVTDKGCVWMVTVSLCVSGSYKVSGCHCLFLHGGVGITHNVRRHQHQVDLSQIFCFESRREMKQSMLVWAVYTPAKQRPQICIRVLLISDSA
ncbi:uncharacterized protein LOC143955338 [Lithobates pipiens]